MASRKRVCTMLCWLVAGLILTGAVSGSPAPGLYLAPWNGHGSVQGRAHRYPPSGSFGDYDAYKPESTTVLPFNTTTPKPIETKQDGQEFAKTEEDLVKLKVETSGSSSPQETHFALSLVPLLRTQPPAARLDAETAMLSYFKRHGQDLDNHF